MFSWRDVEANREHHKELLREAEKSRLIRQLKAEKAATTPSLWQQARGLLASLLEKRQTARKQVLLQEGSTRCY
jgi:hypothetical protein